MLRGLKNKKALLCLFRSDLLYFLAFMVQFCDMPLTLYIDGKVFILKR